MNNKIFLTHEFNDECDCGYRFIARSSYNKTDHLWGEIELRLKPKLKAIYICNFYIHEDFQGHGLGTKVFEKVLRIGEKIMPDIYKFYLYVAPTNVPAIKIYKRFDFYPAYLIDRQDTGVISLRMERIYKRDFDPLTGF